MYKSETFGRIFWVDDNYEFKSCPLCIDGTGDFDVEDYVSEWEDWEGVDYNKLFNIHKFCILNKINYSNSLTHREAPVVDTFSTQNESNMNTYNENLYNYAMQHYTWDETFYNEIVKDSEFSYGKFNETNYPLHSHRHLQQH